MKLHNILRENYFVNMKLHNILRENYFVNMKLHNILREDYFVNMKLHSIMRKLCCKHEFTLDSMGKLFCGTGDSSHLHMVTKEVAQIITRSNFWHSSNFIIGPKC